MLLFLSDCSAQCWRPPTFLVYFRYSPIVYHVKQGGVLYMEPLSAQIFQLQYVGQIFISFLPLANSGLRIVTAHPAGPRFFWSPAYMHECLLTSTGIEQKFDDMS